MLASRRRVLLNLLFGASRSSGEICEADFDGWHDKNSEAVRVVAKSAQQILTDGTTKTAKQSVLFNLVFETIK